MQLLKDDRGTSMAELLVTMMITALVLAGTVVASVGLQRSAALVIARQDQVDIGREAGSRLNETLASAIDPSALTINCPTCTTRALESADGKSMTLYSNLDNVSETAGAVKVTYSVPTSGPQAGHLVETAQTATVAGGTFSFCNTSVPACKAATVTTRDLTPNATVSIASPIFRYFNADNVELGSGGVALTAVQLPSVMSVEMTLTVQRSGATQAKATTFVERITLSNQQANLQAR